MSFDAEERALLASDPSVTHDQAVATLLDAFGDLVATVTTRRRTDDDRWLDEATGRATSSFDG